MKDAPAKSQPPFFPPRAIWILGAGHFGTIAAQRLSKRHPAASFLVVDAREEKLAGIETTLGLPTQSGNVMEVLSGSPLPDDLWLIPAVPRHVTFEWLAQEINKTAWATPSPVPETVDEQVPNPYRIAPNGTLYASYATFLCPDACNEPDEICTHTGQPRPGNLYEELSRIRIPEHTVVVNRSWQLAPGVGGYPAVALKTALATVLAAGGKYLIATSCRCHGVIDCLEWR